MSERVLCSRLLEGLISGPSIKNVRESSIAKNYRPVSLFTVVSKVFVQLKNNRIFDLLEKCGLCSDFRYGFRSSLSTADLLTVLSDRTARAFNRSRALDISKAISKVCHAGLFHKLKSYGISGQIFGSISSFLPSIVGFRWFWMNTYKGFSVEIMTRILNLKLHYSNLKTYRISS